MKLSKETLEILNSFKDINPSILVYPGNTIRTKSEDNRILAEAVVDETFEREFAFYSIKGFLDAHNIIGSPDLIFSEESYVLLKESKSELKYYFSEPELITAPARDLNFQLSSKDVCFELTQTQLNKMNRMTTFDSDRKNWIVDFNGNGTEIQLHIYHKNEPTSPSYNNVIGETSHNFRLSAYLDSFWFITGSYNVVISVSPRFVLEATSTTRNLRYILPLSPDSTFES